MQAEGITGNNRNVNLVISSNKKIIIGFRVSILCYMTVSVTHQVPGSIGSSQVTLDVGVEDLDGGLDKTASGEMLVVLDERQPRLQQLVVGLHVDHVVLIQLTEKQIHGSPPEW